jgi:hypothetical protein
MATRGGSSSCFRVVRDCWCSILKIELMMMIRSEDIKIYALF